MTQPVSFKDLLYKFENKAAEIVFHWKDTETEAEGWTVINSLRGGAAGGGTRMRKGLTENEVLSLAKTMEIKFSVCGPPIGGAKSGINFDPADPRKEGVLKRWFTAVYPILKNYYGTGGDLNVDEIHEVIPYTSSLGLLHPQEGIVNGHLKLNSENAKKRIENLQTGVAKKLEENIYNPDITKGYTIADMITGWGVAESVRHYYNLWGGMLEGKTAVIQGWGNVGAAAGWYLSKMGVMITGIIDRNGGVLKSSGFTHQEIHELFIQRKGNELVSNSLIPFEEINQKIWKTQPEIFIPAAASRLVSAETINDLIDGGLEVISCGANVPFADKEIFFGPISENTDQQVSVIPDFIANCGMARVFAYLMTENAKVQDEEIFNDVSRTIEMALMKAQSFNSKTTGISRKALEISLHNLMQVSD